MTTELTQLDVIFISYDEDNCEENYADLLSKIPWAKRVHGVRGSDDAHKAAARLSETDRFISVDADNIVDSSFFDQVIDFEHEKFKDKVVSWSAKNHINGLEYGNGGLKCWPVQYVLDMKSHEHSSSPHAQVDFCWDTGYVQMNNRYCTTYPNGSPRQAFRAGFREGVKMTLDRGIKVTNQKFTDVIWHGNLTRLLIWLSVGEDVEYGDWAIYGARLGCYMTNCTDWDYVNVRDFEYLNQLFFTLIGEKFSNNPDRRCIKSGVSWNSITLSSEIIRLGNELKKAFDLPFADMGAEQSKFFKHTYVNMPRMGVYTTEQEMSELVKMNK